MPDPIYATLQDLADLGLPPTFLATIPTSAQTAVLSARSRWADSFIRAQFTLPLIQWGMDLTMAVVAAASYDLAVRRGYSPEAGADPNIRLRYEDAQKWMYKVAAGGLTPSVTDSTPGAQEGITADGPTVATGTPRGWSSRGTNPLEPDFGYVDD